MDEIKSLVFDAKIDADKLQGAIDNALSKVTENNRAIKIIFVVISENKVIILYETMGVRMNWG